MKKKELGYNTVARVRYMDENGIMRIYKHLEKGIAFMNSGDINSAIAEYYEAERLAKKYIENDKNNINIKKILVRILINKATALKLKKSYEEAEGILLYAEKLLRELRKILKKNEISKMQIQISLELGDIFKSKRNLDGAVKKYLSVREIFSSLNLEGTIYVHLQKRCVEGLFEVGKMYKKIGSLKDALDLLSKADEVIISLKNVAKADTSIKELHAKVLLEKSGALKKLGKTSIAEKLHQKAINILSSLNGKKEESNLKENEAIIHSSQIKEITSTHVAYSEEEKHIDAKEKMFSDILFSLISSFTERKMITPSLEKPLFKTIDLVTKKEDYFRRLSENNVATYMSEFVNKIKTLDVLSPLFPYFISNGLVSHSAFLESIEFLKYKALQEIRVTGSVSPNYSIKNDSMIKRILMRKDKIDYLLHNTKDIQKLQSLYDTFDIEVRYLRQQSNKNKSLVKDKLTFIRCNKHCLFVSGFDTPSYIAFMLFDNVSKKSRFFFFSGEDKELEILVEIIRYHIYILELLNCDYKQLVKKMIAKLLDRTVSEYSSLEKHEQIIFNFLRRKFYKIYETLESLSKINKFKDDKAVMRIIIVFANILKRNHFSILFSLMEEYNKLLEKFYQSSKGKEFIDFLLQESDRKIIVFSPFGGLYLFPLELLPLSSPIMFTRRVIRTFSLVEEPEVGSISKVKMKEENRDRVFRIFGLIDVGSRLNLIDDDLKSLYEFSREVKGQLELKKIKQTDPINRLIILEKMDNADMFYYSGHGNYGKENPFADAKNEYRTFLSISNGTKIDYNDLLLMPYRKRKFGAFLNCCDSALMMPRRSTIDLFGILPAFISAGFRFVLAPVLPIYEVYANAFFKTYFKKLLERKNITDALYETRIAFKNGKKRKILEDILRKEDMKDARSNRKIIEFMVDYLIWMIQLYGDPNTELVMQ